MITVTGIGTFSYTQWIRFGPPILAFVWMLLCSFGSWYAIDYPLVIPAGHPSQTSDALEFLRWGALGLLPVAVMAGILARDRKTMAMGFGTGALISSGMGLLFDAFMIIEYNSSSNKAHGYAFIPPPLWIPLLEWMAAWVVAFVV